MTSPVDTSVKFFADNFPGAPILNGVVGSGLSVLDACLNTGFGLRSVISLVVASGVATITLATDAKNINLLYSVVLVDGVTGSMTDLNGEQRVTAVSSTTLVFATSLADGTAAGTITVKTAPAGQWEKSFTGTNKAVFRSIATESLGMRLRVDDSNAQYMLLRGYESMSDIDTGTGPFPTIGSSTNGCCWKKSTAANSNTTIWDLFADYRVLYFCPAAANGQTPTNVGQAAYMFGDPIAYKSGDAFCPALFGSAVDPSNTAGNGNILVGGQGSTSGTCVFPRSYVGVGSPVQSYSVSISNSGGGVSGSDNIQGNFPPGTDGALRLSKMNLFEGGSSGLTVIPRAEVPGVYYCPQDKVGLYMNRGDTVIIGGRRLRVVSVSSLFSSTQSGAGAGFFDITGPWR